MDAIIGTIINKYQIIEKLGEGGMATVFRARDTRLERDVALKVIRREAFTLEVLDRVLIRFDREAKTLAKLTHPNIVPIIDYGEYNGSPYLVMPFLPGGTLKSKMGHPMPWEKTIKIIKPIASALAYAHDQGVVHRDVKPANILITASGEPMLTDFGIAKILDMREGQTLTGTGVGIGTPEYMAPEQGLGRDTDSRADIYSLGVVFYEMVTGQKPFIADTPLAVIVKHLHDPIPRPGNLVLGLPKEVENVILTCMAKDPKERFFTMHEMVESLQRLEMPGGVTMPLQSETTNIVQSNRDSLVTGIDNKSIPPVIQFLQPPQIQAPPHQQKRSTSSIVWKWISLLVLVIGLGVILLLTGKNAQIPILFAAKDTSQTPSESITNFPLIMSPISTLAVPDDSDSVFPVLLQNISSENIDKLSLLTNWNPQDGNIRMKYSPDGDVLASYGAAGICFYDSKSLVKLNVVESMASNIAFSPDGEMVASAWGSGISQPQTGVGEINIWRVSDGSLIRTIIKNEQYIHGLAFSPMGDLLASNASGRIKIWRVSDGQLMQSINIDSSGSVSLVFSPDGQMLASLSGSISLWNVSTGDLIRIVGESDDFPTDFAISPNGEYLALDSGQGTLKLWRISDGSLVQKFPIHGDATLRSVEFSPDGKLLVASTWNGDVNLWEVESGKLLYYSEELYGQTATFSPDGKLFMYSCTDGYCFLGVSSS